MSFPLGIKFRSLAFLTRTIFVEFTLKAICSFIQVSMLLTPTRKEFPIPCWKQWPADYRLSPPGTEESLRGGRKGLIVFSFPNGTNRRCTKLCLNSRPNRIFGDKWGNKQAD